MCSGKINITISKVAQQIGQLVEMLLQRKNQAFVLGVTLHDNKYLSKIKRLNTLVKENLYLYEYRYIPISSKMSSMRNVDADGVHLSRHGATNLKGIIRKFLRS